MASDIFARYFVFSKEQMDKRKAIEESRGRRAIFGTVLVNGVYKIYTDIVTSMDKCRFGDSILVTKADIRKVKYTLPN